MRYRALPECRKVVVDELEDTFRLAQALHPELVSFSEWLEQLLLSANAAVRTAYEAQRVGIER